MSFSNMSLSPFCSALVQTIGRISISTDAPSAYHCAHGVMPASCSFWQTASSSVWVFGSSMPCSAKIFVL